MKSRVFTMGVTVAFLPSWSMGAEPSPPLSLVRGRETDSARVLLRFQTQDEPVDLRQQQRPLDGAADVDLPTEFHLILGHAEARRRLNAQLLKVSDPAMEFPNPREHAHAL